VKWKNIKLETLMRIETGSRNTEDKIISGRYPFFVRSQEVERIADYTYDCEAVLTAGDGVGTGKIFHYINGKFNAHQRVYVMSQFNGIDGKYFYYYFSHNFLDEVSKYTAKSSVDSVRRAMIADMEIPLPPLPEQRYIATILSDTYELIATLDKLIAKKRAIKQGAMQELMTGKRRLFGFSGKWVETTLGEICEIKDGTHQTPNYKDYGIPFYSVENITNNNFTNTKYISLNEHQKLTTNYKIERGDILMTRIGSIGVCKYVDWNVNASFYVSLALLKCTNTVNAKFLSLYSQSEQFKKEIDLHSLQHAIPKKINLGNIALVRLLLPTIDEQTAIASILSDMDAEIDTLTAKLNKLRNIKQGMMSELLTGRIRLPEQKTETASEANETLKIKKLTKQTTKKVASKTSGHNQQFDDAVMIAGIVNVLYSDKYPLGRKKVQKCLYLLRRHQDESTAAFKKKAAGPYADEVRYNGGEPIAMRNGYIKTQKGNQGTKFAVGEKVSQALGYIENWGKQSDIQWVEDKLKYKGIEKLELLATVDMAICDLTEEGIPISVAAIKNLIANNAEWKAKLKKQTFSDDNIADAIHELQILLQGENQP